MNSIRKIFIKLMYVNVIVVTSYIFSFQLTPGQVNEARRQLQTMSPEEIDQRIKSLGMTREEAEKRARENGIDLQAYLQKTSSVSVSSSEPSAILPSGPSNISNEQSNQTIASQRQFPTWNGLKYFGYDVFALTPSAFEPTAVGPVDPDYIIGPEDILRVSIWGQVEQQNELAVDKEGRIFIPSAGPIVVSGQTVSEINKTLTKQLSRSIQGLTSTPKTVWLDVSLAKIRPKRVFIMGEVNNPGGYTVNSYSTIFNSLFAVGGPTVNGSLREVRLIRENKIIAKVDLYLYLTGAEKNTDIRVQNNDIIFVPVRKSTVYVSGEIRRPGVYELLPGENLKKLVEFAGGYLPSTYLERIQIERPLPFKERTKNEFEKKYVDINFRDVILKNRDFTLNDGDVVTFFPIQTDLLNYVSISGIVNKPGKYQYVTGMRLFDVIQLADSLRPDAYTIRGELIRVREDNITREIIPFDLAKLISGDQQANLLLQPRDEIFIHSKSLISLENEFVEIFGFVKKPGRHVLTKNMTLSDIIIMAGGYTEEASRLNAEIARINTSKYSKDSIVQIKVASLPDLQDTSTITNFLYFEQQRKNDLLLKHRDQIFVRSNPAYRMQKIITITGEVLYPGEYVLSVSNEYLSDIISRAGGVTASAYLRGGRLVRQGQRVKIDFQEALDRPKQLNDIVLQSGDQIEIPPKPNSINISGEVNNPGIFSYRENYSLKDYITQSGGLTDSADFVILTHPNGFSERYSLWIFSSNPKVMDGSSIWVSKIPKPADNGKDLDIGNLIRDLFAITASALTILVLARQL